MQLFVTGMFRSGTTTLARALNAHSKIAFASDPFLEFFKVLRSDLAEDLNQSIPFKSPLDDYYFDSQGLTLLSAIEQANPKRPFQFIDWEELQPSFSKRCLAYCPKLKDFLQDFSGETYQEALFCLLAKVQDCYGDQNSLVYGFKEVWGTEFVPFFLNACPQGKVIVFQRDPRAVCASKNVTEEKYPWLFLCRQWRKLAALGWYYANNLEYNQRVLLLRYEDFITTPEKVTQQICRFLEIDWEEAIANPSYYKNGNGQPWKQNTSYGEGIAGFDQTAINRWQNKLTKLEQKYIEEICAPEMSLLEYERENSEFGLSEEWLFDSPRIQNEEQAAWMRNIIPNDPAYISVEMAKEYLRNSMLKTDSSKLPSNLIKQAFLKDNLFQYLKESK